MGGSSAIAAPMGRELRIALLFCVLASCSDRPGTPAPPAAAGQGQQGGGTDDDGGAQASDDAVGICTRSAECEQRIPIDSAQHVQGPIAYPDPPPAGGDHDPCWGSWGVHDTPLAAPHWVHNLEHGGVVLLYHCPDGCEAEVSMLAAFVSGHPRTLLTEYPDMEARFAVVAWGYRLAMHQLDLDAIADFYAAHFDRAPESIDADPPSGC